VHYQWERLAERVFRCRLRFCDVTVGLVWGTESALLVDAGTTVSEARGSAADAADLAGVPVRHVVLTHHDFDHVLGASAFPDATVYAAPAVAQTMAVRPDAVRAEAVRYGADPAAVDEAIAAWRTPQHLVWSADIGLGDRTVAVRHPGRGHTDHDLIAVVPGSVTGTEPTVVFCGDLVEESGDPVIDAHSDPAAWPATLDRILEFGGEDAVYVPGHGSVVDAAFVHRQRQWLIVHEP
jgi:glyoxylase-like metal-dependent hydrolase (beta-lactamase superfamily II)